MKNVFISLPVYTGDVSGAASALYELGGMSVIHDPSGCNSTYNTHDEIRWYTKNSLIYVSGLSEVDAITGNDNKFIADVIQASEKVRPRFIALFNSPIPYINGTDFKGIARIIEKKTGISCFHIETNAMHDYSVGISNAFYEYAMKFLPKEAEPLAVRTENKKINIIGMTPLDFAEENSVDSIKRRLENEGYTVNSIWAQGCSAEDIHKSHEADVNLILSSTGIKLGKLMKERYGIPYISAAPVGIFGDKILKKLHDSSLENLFLSDNKYNGETVVVGETIVSLSIAAEFEEEFAEKATVIATTELGHEYLREGDIFLRDEKDIVEALKPYKRVIADPLFRKALTDECEFIEIPHLAYSGRLFLDRIPDLFNETFRLVGKC